ncbi:hypothetical protein LPJ66_001648 [Kickxella alabastrina]|uniref:Uncharacterized protein n=1 Tax=Kickxella alabastrina TaxID=61397 RepID=A0ACC1ISP2_9FUNG|nr:hypothetical protein LPJ66_001648 [Kickxella alabastrina]
MTDRSRSKTERDQQTREKRLFLSIAGLGFAASLLAAVALGHRRAHKAALLSGESIQTNHVNSAIKAFGLGTLYALGFVGCGVAGTNYYLQTKGVGSMAEAAQSMRERVAEKTGGSLMERLGISPEEDERSLRRVDELVGEEDGDGRRKIRFARIKGLVAGGGGGAMDGGGDEQKTAAGQGTLSIGARMRRMFGFAKRKDADSD